MRNEKYMKSYIDFLRAEVLKRLEVLSEKIKDSNAPPEKEQSCLLDIHNQVDHWLDWWY